MDQNSGKKNLLIVLPSVPYPLRADGTSVRYLPLIEHLSGRCNIDILVIHESKVDRACIEGLSTFCRRVMTVPVPPSSTFGVVKKGCTLLYHMLPWTEPYLLIKHGGDSMVREILGRVGQYEYDTLLWVTASYTPYLSRIVESVKPERVVVDFIDSPALWARRVAKSSKKQLFAKYESWKMTRWEGRVARDTSAVIYISPVDAEAVPVRLTKGVERHVVNNGINIENHSTSVAGEIPGPNIGFLGNMGYGPNIEAVSWLYEKVYLPLRKAAPGLHLIIIGRNPEEGLKDLGGRDGVIVTGHVDDIWPYINSVDIFVFPIWMGTGIKNKVLEAMYARRPVITTPIGNDGIDGESGKHLIICDTERDFYRTASELFNSEEKRKGLGEEGHSHVAEKFCWENKLKEFERILFS